MLTEKLLDTILYIVKTYKCVKQSPSRTGYLYITTAINTITPGAGSINIYPNPSRGIFTFAFEATSARMNRSDGQNFVSKNIEVSNTLGEKVHSQFTTHNSPFTIDLSSQPNGFIFIGWLPKTEVRLGMGRLRRIKTACFRH
jgi:hypothetical protein